MRNSEAYILDAPSFDTLQMPDKSLFRQSPAHMDLHRCFPSCCLYLTMPSNRFLNHLIVSSLLTLCCLPIFDLHRRLLATRAPGRVLDVRLASIYTFELVHSTNMQQ
jgi:hypothetical protein